MLAAAVWGPGWQGRAVRFRCDNAAIVHVLHTSKSHEPLVMQLLRGLHLFAMEHAFHFSAQHIAGKDNGPADALSRNYTYLFHSQVTQAQPVPEPLTADLLQLLLAEHPPDWISSSWRRQLITILGKASPSLPTAHINLASSNTSNSATRQASGASQHQSTS